ncbi:hypothetical protein AV650_08160 [Serratia fonticola]|nr:hypothetical protein AV650_08160 [Serratia fonticola]
MAYTINMQTHDAPSLQVALYQEKGGTAHFGAFLGNEKFMHQEVEKQSYRDQGESNHPDELA